MKKIYYFTGTGNSLYIARKIADGIGDVELVAIKDEMKKDCIVIDSDFTGFVYPVYCFGIPRIVRDFLVKIDIKSSGYFFCVANAGAPKYVPANIMTEKLLKNKGVSLNSAFVVAMPNNYIPMSAAPSDEQIKHIIANSDIKIAEIIGFLKEKKSGYIEKGLFFVRFAHKFANFFYKNLQKASKNYNVSDKCNSCGECAKICPVDNITMIDGKPSWGKNCEQCMACLQHCPVEAIEYGRSSVGKKRYWNPFV
ncbi:MAG: EFR1 family ferrodoxin [Candidatus Muirbacterium halophilum]|nr:EFR1 family ferrodoxin [Candidatus Muirbacterium halophilum]